MTPNRIRWFRRKFPKFSVRLGTEETGNLPLGQETCEETSRKPLVHSVACCDLILLSILDAYPVVTPSSSARAVGEVTPSSNNRLA